MENTKVEISEMKNDFFKYMEVVRRNLEILSLHVIMLFFASMSSHIP